MNSHTGTQTGTNGELEEATTTDHPIPMVIRGGPSSVTHLGPDPTIFEHESPRGGADE